MNICKIDISNFRGIKKASILVSKNAVFVGDNNSGKSTLFEAVDLVMGPDRLSRSPVIDEHDFYAGEYLANNTPVQIKIEVTVIGLSEDQKIYFGNHIEWWDRCKGALEINTYHGFIWNIIKHHGYLLNSQSLHLLPPHESGHRLSGLSETERKKKMLEMFNTEGTVHFDIFANICTRLLTESHALKKIICAMYPVIILDEFQDTSADEWQLIQLLGTNSDLLKDARHLRLLQRGSQLYAALDILWRENGSYIGATEAVANALTQEHFSMSTRKWSGVNVMTIHKSKGKEFDAVIVYEGRYQNRIISKPERREQATLNLRVAVTRAKEHTYILTPNDDPCSLL